MSKIKIGPLSRTHCSLIREKLQNANVSFEITEDPEALNSFQNEFKSQPITNYPTYSGAPEYIYIEFDKEHIFHIRKEIDKLGISLKQFTPEDSPQAEYICPKCKYISTSAGFCPVHQWPLVEYFKWARQRYRIKYNLEWLILLSLAVIAIVLAFFNSKTFFILKTNFPNHITSIGGKTPIDFYSSFIHDSKKYCELRFKFNFWVESDYLNIKENIFGDGYVIKANLRLFLKTNGEYMAHYQETETSPELKGVTTSKTLTSSELNEKWTLTENGELALNALGLIRGGVFEGEEVLLLKTQAFRPSQNFKDDIFILKKAQYPSGKMANDGCE